ncbi:vacuolar protein sorting-associated protein 16 homolog [Anopheles bellator]|uniref:vacuolar protein sorting-associated protein 16 homolog n=1 Tax=Anopheles bellator TaxID=139047 RepID=UPI0026479B1E|nr:vacuolar protein sorting-associated protein 16 homolog [Anopheles bellator]
MQNSAKMSLLCNTGDWFTLGQGNAFRKIELYAMEWPPNVNLDNMIVHAAAYGGPIVVMKDPKSFIKIESGISARPMILYIFNCVGKLLSSINWDCGVLVRVGWSDAEELVVVQDDGTIFIYDMFGNFVHKFSISKDVTDVIDARIFTSASGTGVAVLTSNLKIYVLNNIKDPKYRPLSDLLNFSVGLTCWEVISRDRTTVCLIAGHGHDVTIARYGDNTLTSIPVTMKTEFKTITAMCASFDHQHLALYTSSGCLWMGSSDLKQKYCEFTTGRTEKPHQLAWCIDGSAVCESQAMIISFSNLIMIVGATGESSIYTYDSSLSLVQEMDSVRVLSSTSHELIQKVPNSTSKIFGINISEPASFLFEAHRKFRERSHQSDEYLCLIQSKLPIAVADCIEAAGHEYDTSTQKSLIRAAYFGKSFLNGYNCDDYIRMCKTLKVLNVLRDPNVAIPITIRQFYHLQPIITLDRLVFRKYYGLAIHIAKYLNILEKRILEHWAFQKIAQDKNDDEVARKIAAKFSSADLQETMSFANVAEKAQQLGKIKLAITLLEMEAKKKLQVPLLLKLGASEKALIAATQSGDIDLIYMALLEMKNTTALAKFHMTIRRYPLAQNLYKKYCQLNSLSTLKDIYSQEDEFLAQAEITLREALQHDNLDATIPDVSANYRRAGKLIEAELSEETKKLIKHQKLLNDKHQKEFHGLSLHVTVRKLLQLGDVRYAEKLKNEFKMPDKRYCWVRVQTLAENFQWEELEKISKSKKSLIGYEPFVEVCLRQLNVAEAKKYLPRCSEENKLKWYLRAGCYVEAANIAFAQKDIDSLLKIYDYCTSDSSLMSTLESMIGQLSKK